MTNLRFSAAVAAIVLVVGSMMAAATGRADEDPRAAALRLAEAAVAEQRRGDELESGWERAYDRGIALANRAIALDPTVADAYYALFLNLGRKAERSGVGAQAFSVSRLKELLQKTLELDPRHAHAWEARGEMLIRLPWWLGGSDAEGERALRRAAELTPSWAKPELRLAELHAGQGHKARARAEAEAALGLARRAGDDEVRAAAEELLRKLGESPR